MVDISYILGFIALVCAALAMVMLFSKDALTCALALLGILIGTAAIYGLQGEHFVATVQLVVYAGAIMVLFVFSIMLLNIKRGDADFKVTSVRFGVAALSGILLFAAGAWAIVQKVEVVQGLWTYEAIKSAGGNTRVLSHSLFTQHFVAYEAVSLALLVAMVAAVTLAKRKIE